MIVDFNKKLVGFEGAEINVTVGKVTRDALTATFTDEKNLNAEAKMERWNLAKKAVGEVDITQHERELINMLVNKTFGTATFGPYTDAMKQVK